MMQMLPLHLKEHLKIENLTGLSYCIIILVHLHSWFYSILCSASRLVRCNALVMVSTSLLPFRMLGAAVADALKRDM